MTLTLSKTNGDQIYDLIFPDYLATMPVVDQETMHQALMRSQQAWIGWEDGKILVVWGLIPPTILSDRAYIWMFTTSHLKEHVFSFVRHSQIALELALKEYPLIVGHTKITNPKAIRWLRWLGAVFHEPIGEFLPFEIKAKS